MYLNSREINNRFQLSWEILSTNSNYKPAVCNKTQEALSKMNRCLKWSLAYANLRNYCGDIIKPYSHQYAMIIKKFWVQYFERNFLLDLPPAPKDFFEWYCDSNIIKEEDFLLKKCV